MAWIARIAVPAGSLGRLLKASMMQPAPQKASTPCVPASSTSTFSAFFGPTQAQSVASASPVGPLFGLG